MGSKTKTAELYRMVMDKHTCPYGLKSKYLLEKKGYSVEDHHLTTRKETDAFKAKHEVKTTPQTFVAGKRIGGYDDLRTHLGYTAPKTTYKPVIAIFSTALLMSFAIAWLMYGHIMTGQIIGWFIAISMCFLGV